MFCSKCGKENEENVKFCSTCGNSFKSNTDKSVEEKAEEIKRKSKESALAVFYLIKPFLKLKFVAPVLLIMFAAIFWEDIEDYRYEKAQETKLVKEQSWVEKYQKEGILPDYK